MSELVIILIFEVALCLFLLISDYKVLASLKTAGKLIVAIDEQDEETPYVFMEFDIPLDELKDEEFVLVKIKRKNIQ